MQFVTFCPNNEKSRVARVFIPGWGFDGRLLALFFKEKLGYWLSPKFLCVPGAFNSDLNNFIKENKIEKIKLVGWSMGANLALDFALAYPDKIESVHLLSMRKFWPKDEINGIRQGLKKDAMSFLRDFYRKCFLGYKEAYNLFASTLQDDYLQADIKVLQQGLTYLEKYTTPQALPPGVDITLIQGRKDIIVPCQEKMFLESAEHKVLPHEGHAVFLSFVLESKV